MLWKPSRRALFASAPFLLAPLSAKAVTAAQYGVLFGNVQCTEKQYLGVVATRGTIPTNFTAAFTTWMTRSFHVARNNITKLKILVPNWYINLSGSFPETGTGASSTVTASVEYPAGTVTQIKFGGQASGTVPDLSSLLSDFCSVNIPVGASFWIRMYLANPNGQVYDGTGFQGSTSNGDLCNNYQGDVTMAGGTAVSSQFAGYMTAPLAVLAMTTAPSFYLIGTSRMAGLGDTNDSSGDLGIAARSIGPAFGYIQGGIPSDTVGHFLASHTQRVGLAQYVTHIIGPDPTNDNPNTTTEANLVALWSLFPGKKIAGITCSPQSTSTDSWATTANQTTTKDYTTINSWLNTVPAPLSATFDVAKITSSGAKWDVNGTANWYTSDGIHESQTANLAIKAAGVVAPAVFL